MDQETIYTLLRILGTVAVVAGVLIALAKIVSNAGGQTKQLEHIVTAVAALEKRMQHTDERQYSLETEIALLKAREAVRHGTDQPDPHPPRRDPPQTLGEDQ